MHRNIVVIGGSAGALTALRRLLPQLPAKLSAAIFLVVHGGDGREALAACSPIEVHQAEDGAPFALSRLHVAPPDEHLLLCGARMRLRRGPRENLARPAIDVLFRSPRSRPGRG